MKSAVIKNPKDDKIVNKDNSVTNKDDISSKVEQTEKQDSKAVLPANDNPELYETEDESSNKGQGPAGENL